MTDPTDRAVRIDHAFYARQWRYECACGWTWANDAQRRANARFYNRAYKHRHTGDYF